MVQLIGLGTELRDSKKHLLLKARLGRRRLALRCVEANCHSIDNLFTVSFCEGRALTLALTLGVSLGELVISKVEIVTLEADSVISGGEHAKESGGEERDLHCVCFECRDQKYFCFQL